VKWKVQEDCALQQIWLCVSVAVVNFTSKSCIVWRLLTKVSTLSWTSPCTTNSTRFLLVIEIVHVLPHSFLSITLFSGSLIHPESFKSLETSGSSTSWRRYAHFYHLSVSIDCASDWGEMNLCSLFSSINWTGSFTILIESLCLFADGIVNFRKASTLTWIHPTNGANWSGA